MRMSSVLIKEAPRHPLPHLPGGESGRRHPCEPESGRSPDPEAAVSATLNSRVGCLVFISPRSKQPKQTTGKGCSYPRHQRRDIKIQNRCDKALEGGKQVGRSKKNSTIEEFKSYWRQPKSVLRNTAGARNAARTSSVASGNRGALSLKLLPAVTNAARSLGQVDGPGE